MILKTALVLALGLIVFCTATYEERPCGRDMQKLWLDIAVVVDTSSGMSKGLPSIAANIATLFRKPNIGNGTVSTRVGLIGYNKDAQILAPLDQFQSAEELSNGVFALLRKPSSIDASYVANGLLAAQTMFDQGEVEHRKHYRRVVIVYASTYKGHGKLDPVPVADRVKSKGVTVITVAFNQLGDGSLLTDLANIATPHRNFTNSNDLIQAIQESLFQANCFCSKEYQQNRQSFSDKDSYRYGTCLKMLKDDADRDASRVACELSHGSLVNEYSPFKYQFVHEFAKEEFDKGDGKWKNYYIGLQKNGGRWYWDQPGHADPVPLDPNYTHWMPGFPRDSQTAVTANESGRWVTVSPDASTFSICEVPACDTDNFCDSDK